MHDAPFPMLRKNGVSTLQVNTGLFCNLACRHCHLEAGPNRTEIMDRRAMADVALSASRLRFATVDITGGSPELAPDIAFLLTALTPLAPERIFRTNLVALRERPELVALLAEGDWTLAASLPSVQEAEVSAQRGGGVWDASLTMLKRLNAAGFGANGPRKLVLVSNPAEASMPMAQDEAEKFFRQELTAKRGIVFDSLFVFANAPLGRFRSWLAASGNLEGYMRTLKERFNPDAMAKLMCRSMVSVRHDGRLFDCDFNQAARLAARWGKHISELEEFPENAPVATGDHCYACAAGSGFT